METIRKWENGMSELCKGCFLKSKCAILAPFKDKCPCAICLVRSMCKGQCNIRWDYFNEFIKYQKQKIRRG